MLGRAKSCQWQVFVRRRPPKQGELRTDVSKATMFQGVDSVLRPRFKALPEILLEKLSNGTCRNRFFAQNGGEKALNRCDVPALQRKDLERTAKEQPCSLQTVGYGWVRMENGARKRVALGGDKKDFLQMKTFSVCEKGGFFCSCKAMPK